MDKPAKPLMTFRSNDISSFIFNEEVQSSYPLGAHSRWAVLNETRKRFAASVAHCKTSGRPFVTVSYAQSVDGSIASGEGKPLSLSSSESLSLTHALRAEHNAILVGIGCVLADNPRLTVRLISGTSPQTVVVDSLLRCPSSVNLFTNNSIHPWIATTGKAEAKRQKLLEEAGARVIRLASAQDSRVDLRALLEALWSMGIKSIMVEGGSKIITSFLLERLVDQFVITVAPLFVGGLRPLDTSAGPYSSSSPRLINTFYEKVGDDLVIRGDPVWADL